MKYFFKICCFLFLSPLFISCVDDSDNHSEILEAQTLLNVSYGNNSQQVYDLYLPKGRNTTKTKVILLIHGGGWTSGDKDDMQGFVTFLQLMRPDYAIANVNYVLANEQNYAFPNQFLDIKSIIQQLTSEKNNLKINPEFGLIGVSAGGHLALMYDYAYDINNQVKFVSNIVGPTDFSDPFYADSQFQDLILAFIDQSAYPQGTDFIEELSPVTHVSSGSSPTSMFFGTDDPLVPSGNGVVLSEALSNQGVYNTLRIYNGGHGGDWSYEDALDMQQIILNYIDTYLP